MCDSWVNPVFFSLRNHIMGLGYFSDSIIWWIFSVSFDKILLKEGWGSLFLSMLCFFFFSFPLTKLTLCSKFQLKKQLLSLAQQSKDNPYYRILTSPCCSAIRNASHSSQFLLWVELLLESRAFQLQIFLYSFFSSCMDFAFW